VRRVSSVVLVLAAAGSLALTVRPLTDPETALGRVAASALGRTGVVGTTAELTAWAWVAVVAAVLLVLASVLAVVAARRWAGLSSRFDAPTEAGQSGEPTPQPDRRAPATERGTRHTAWDDLTEGRDPTIDGPSPEGRST
jgi:uncharacterized membrane protein (TIGR02234 family)